MSMDAGPRVNEPQAEPAAGPPPWRGRLIGGGVAAAAVLFVALTRPEVITGSFGTVGSTLRVLGLIGAFIVLSLLVSRFVANKILGKVIVWGLAAALIAVAVVPSYFDEEVDQDLATSAADLGLDEAPEADPPPAPTADTGAGAPATTSDPAPAAEAPPVKLTTGQLSGLAGHRGSGEAAVYELDDGTRFVRLEDFDVSNGPGIELWVVPTAGAESPDGGIKLADVPGNNGNFNAAIPGDFDASGEVTVLLWCAPIGTPMAHATQAAV